MKKTLFLLFSFCFLLSASPLIHYRFDGADGRKIRNCAGEKYPANVTGKLQLSDKNTLLMDGISTEITLEDTGSLDLSRGATFMLLYRHAPQPGNKQIDMDHDMFLYRDQQFLFGRRLQRLYLNFCGENKKFLSPVYTHNIFPADGKYHHIALTLFHRVEPAHGVDCMEIRIYLDGVLAYKNDIRNLKMRPADGKPLELACGRSFGPPWRLGGEIGDVRYYSRVLSLSEIRKIVSGQKLAVPAFRSPAKLRDEERKLLSQVKARGIRSALTTLLQNNKGRDFLNEAVRTPGKYFYSLAGKESVLTVLDSPQLAGVFSWYDRKTQRELLRWDNTFFELILQKDGRNHSVSPADPGVSCKLLRKPVQADGGWRFAMSYTHSQWSAKVDFFWVNDRLEYRVTPRSILPVLQLNAPQARLNPLRHDRAYLCVPEEIGRVLDSSVASGVTYSGTYPGRRGCMQLGAYYDAKGGVFASSGDPLGRIQELGMSAGSEGAELNFRQIVSRNGAHKSCAVLELFRGDWYDSAQCYRRLLDRMKPSWWAEKMVGYPTPEWMKANTLNINYAYLNENHAHLHLLRKYFGLPYVVTVEGSHDRGEKYIAGVRLHPDMLEYARDLQKSGIRVQLYINARIIQEYSRSTSAAEFASRILPGVVRRNGKHVFEYYPDSFGNAAVICPYTQIYQKQVCNTAIRYASQGVDGIYLDQFACTTPVLCSDSRHGHPANDPDSWFYNGQRKTIAGLRQEFARRNYTDKYFSHETNGEVAVGLSDIATPWSAVFQDQVPLFHQVYSGRIQSGFRDRVGENEGSAFVKDAEQILWGEQLGRLNNRNLTSPLRFDYRSYVKRLMHLRTGLLEYFNSGVMARIPRQEPEPALIPQVWSRMGSRVLARPAVLAGCWKLGTKTAVIAINTTDRPQETTLCFDGAADPAPWFRYSSDGGTKKVKVSSEKKYFCRLEAYGCMVLTNAPDPALDDAFRVIRATRTERDPFAFDPGRYPERKLELNKTFRAVESHVLGAQKALAANEINYIYYGVVYPGVLDFGSRNEVRHFEMELSAPPESGDGRLRIYIDRIQPENEIFSMPLDSGFHTKSWRDYRRLSGRFNRPLSGKHRIIFCFSGSSVCNFRSWKIF